MRLCLGANSIDAENDVKLKINPPLRDKTDVAALRNGLKNGLITSLASDHAPHTREEKEAPSPPSGVPNLDTYGPFVTWLIKKVGVDPITIARVCSLNPAHFLGIKQGRIVEGYIGSFTVLDLDTPVVITAEDLYTKCGWSPFEGVTFPGRVAATIVNGKMIELDSFG